MSTNRSRQGSTYNPEVIGALRYDRSRNRTRGESVNQSTASTTSTRGARRQSNSRSTASAATTNSATAPSSRKRFTSVSSDPNFRALAAQLAEEEATGSQGVTRADEIRVETQAKRNVRRSTNANAHVVHRAGAEDRKDNVNPQSGLSGLTNGNRAQGDNEDEFIDRVEEAISNLSRHQDKQDNSSTSHRVMLGIAGDNEGQPDWVEGSDKVSHVSETSPSSGSAGGSGQVNSAPRTSAGGTVRTPDSRHDQSAIRSGSPIARHGSFKQLYERGVSPSSNRDGTASPRERVQSVGRRESTSSLQELWVQLRENRAAGRPESDIASLGSGGGSLIPQDVLDRIKAEEEARAKTQAELNSKLTALQEMEKRAAAEERDRAEHLRKVERSLREQADARASQQAKEEEALRVAAERARIRQEAEANELRTKLHQTNSELTLLRERSHLEELTLKEQLERERGEKLRLERELRARDDRLSEMSSEVTDKLNRAKKAAKEQFVLKRKLNETQEELVRTSSNLDETTRVLESKATAAEKERERLREEKQKLLEELAREREAAAEEKRRLANEREDLTSRLREHQHESSRTLNDTRSELELIQAKAEVEGEKARTLASELNRTQSELEVYRTKTETLTTDHTRLQTNHEALESEHTRTKEELNQAISQARERIVQLEREHADKESKSRRLEDKLNESTAEVKAKTDMVGWLSDKNAKYEETLTKEMQDRTQLMEALMAKTADADDLRAQIVRLNTDLTNERQEKTLLRSEVVDAKREATTRAEEAVAATRRYEDTRAELEQTKDDLRLLDETLQASLKRIEDMQSSFDEKHKENAALHELTTLLREETTVKDAEIDALLQKDQRIMGELEQLGSRNIKAEKSLKKSQDRVTELEFQVAQLQETVERERDIRADMEATFNARGRETDDLARSNSELSHRVRTLEASTRQMSAERDEHLDEIKRLKAKANRLTSQLRVNDSARHDLSDKMARHEAHLDELAAQKQRLNETVHDRESQVRSLIKKNAVLAEKVQEESLRVRMMETASHDGVYDMSKEQARLAIEVQQAHAETRESRAELSDLQIKHRHLQDKYLRLRRTIEPLLEDPSLSARLELSQSAMTPPDKHAHRQPGQSPSTSSFVPADAGAYSVGSERRDWSYELSDFDPERASFRRSPYA